MRQNNYHKLYLKSPKEILQIVASHSKLSQEDNDVYQSPLIQDLGYLTELSENVFSAHLLPLSIVPNFLVNGKERLIPYAIEEPGVVAGAALGAKLCRASGGFSAWADEPLMVGQIVLAGITNPKTARRKFSLHRKRLLQWAIKQNPDLRAKGRYPIDYTTRLVRTKRGKMLSVDVVVKVGNATGCRAVEAYCETMASELARLGGGRIVLKLHTNLADKRITRAKAVWRQDCLGENRQRMPAEELTSLILDLAALAQADPYRASTHNKGIMNGVDALAIATCNDWRIQESAAHAYAARNGRYTPLSEFVVNKKGDLVGTIELPIVMGVEGGIIDVHPYAQLSKKIMNITTARELAQVAASVGLAQNFAALRQLALGGMREADARLREQKSRMVNRTP